MATPAVEELRQTLTTKFPDILGTTFFDKYAKKKMARLQAPPGTHANSATYDPSADPHVKGLALDIFLFANDSSRPLEQPLAENLVDLFVYYKNQMGWSAVIYNGVTTDDFGGPKSYTGANPHTTHIHIEWPASRASNTGYSNAMSSDLDDLEAAWQSGGPFPNG
jgi:hypothetical protein